ncbi:hypothetical protein F4804DRAFT_348886 [Jackrogersella minutella]|nr:hypothetical protein F4804DRAFT_348886 [Jackrogersella minutella]
MAVIKNWKNVKDLPAANPNGEAAHKDADGWVTTTNLFMCVCGSVMKNQRHNISSHLTKKHNPGSAYQMGQWTNVEKPWACPDCSTHHPNWHALLAHHRRGAHDFRGESDGLREENDPHKPDSSLEDEYSFIKRALRANRDR